MTKKGPAIVEGVLTTEIFMQGAHQEMRLISIISVLPKVQALCTSTRAFLPKDSCQTFLRSLLPVRSFYQIRIKQTLENSEGLLSC